MAGASREELRQPENADALCTVWGKLYRREVLEGIRFVEGKRIHEDSFFLFQVFGRELRMAVCAEPSIYYYMTAQSASRSGFSDKFLDILYFAEEKAKIVAKLEGITGKTVILKNTVDESILGGITLRYSGTQLDGSLRSRLQKLERLLKGAIV